MLGKVKLEGNASERFPEPCFALPAIRNRVRLPVILQLRHSPAESLLLLVVRLEAGDPGIGKGASEVYQLRLA